MSKTARDVMTPGGSWPGSEFGDPMTGGQVGVGLIGSTVDLSGVHAIGADDWIDQALATMTELKVRRLPVVDHGRLVGVVSQGDLASSIEEPGTWSWLCK
jgi:CBS domain-containing protein